MFSSLSKYILTAKIVFISSGVISIAIAMKFAVPMVINFVLYELPTLWSALRMLFKPLYLYVIINVIIIIIWVSSRFTRNEPSNLDDQSQPLIISAPTPPQVEISAGFVEVEERSAVMEVVVYEDEDDDEVLEVKKAVVVNGFDVVEMEEEAAEIEVVPYAPPHKIVYQETEIENFWPVTEKPPVSSTFRHQKPLKASREGKRALRIASLKKHETLESTWKMISETNHVLPTPHLKKSETFNQNHERHKNMIVSEENCFPPNSHMRKSETFKDRTNYNNLPKNLTKITKEPSLSQDELNRRAEDFINKFNEDMRLQKQESLKQHMKKINREANY